MDSLEEKRKKVVADFKKAESNNVKKPEYNPETGKVDCPFENCNVSTINAMIYTNDPIVGIQAPSPPYGAHQGQT